ncbi:MAG UNVERIFIED_CONTAM: PKD domain-containing protein [Anaerolineae bacterium]|jgi:hypothetical protein
MALVSAMNRILPTPTTTLGIILVTLTLADAQGVTSLSQTTISVTSALQASFVANPTSGTTPLTVTFDSSASTGSISSYTWDFGDGVGFSNEPNPFYTFNNAGDYLRHAHACGCAGCHKSFADDDFGNECIAGIVRSKLHQRNNPIDGDV